MVLNRWWLAAALVVCTVLAVLLLTSDRDPWRLALGLGALVAFLVAWAVLAKDASDGNRAALALTVVTVVVSGAGTASMANFAIFQCLAFPLSGWLRAQFERPSSPTSLWRSRSVSGF